VSKRIKILYTLFMLPAILFAGNISLKPVSIYPLPSIYTKSLVFSLMASGLDIPVVNYTEKYDYAHFLMNAETAEVIVSLTDEDIVTYNISPKKLKIPAQIKSKQLIFTIHKGDYLIIKINKKKELVIVADAEVKDQPKRTGKGIFDVLDPIYHADPTGETLTTNSIQNAINDASAYKNGTVYIPAGVYKVGNIELKSNTAIYLEEGAVLLFSGKAEDYTINARKDSQKRNITWWIYTKMGAKHIKLFGNGTLDGNGKFATEKGKIGNHILAIMGAEHFTLDGLIIRNSGAWAIIPTRSKNVVLKNFKLFNRFDMGENDGVDVIESENVLVKHAIGIALDDPFSTKTWEQNTDLCRNWPGSPKAQKNIVFEDCLSWTYCYGFKIGQGVMQPQSNIKFKNCVVYDAAVGIGIHHKWGTAFVKNVVFDGIDIEKLSYQNDDHRTWAIFLMQNGDKKGSGPISNITVKNILVRDAGKSPGKIKGISEVNNISHLTFSNIKMPNLSLPAQNLKELRMTDIAFADAIKVFAR
jgi:polygalacturonase